MIEQLFAFAAMSALVLFPGLALSWALLYGTNFGRFAKFFFGIILGLLAVPALSVGEFIFLGIKMSASLVFANAGIITILALACLYYQRKSFALPKVSEQDFSGPQLKHFLVKNKILGLLAIIVLFGFFARINTSWNPTFFEFDPYYYDLLTEMVVKDGATQVYGDDAFFPQNKFHRDAPLMQYMTAGWYLVYQAVTNTPFDKFAMIYTIQLYPALVGALLSFLAFMLMRDETGDKIALLVAAMFALTPQLIKKLSAGVSEQQPFGIFLIILIITVFALAYKAKSLRLGIFAGASTFFAMIGTLQFIFPFMVLTAFIAIQSILDFLADKLDWKSVAISGLAVFGAVLGNVLLGIYQERLFLANGVVLLIASFALCVALFLLKTFASHKAALWGSHHGLTAFYSRVALGAGISLGAVALFFATPLQKMAFNYLDAVLSISKTSKPILKTVQEEGISNSAFHESSFGVFHGMFSPENLLFYVTVLVCAVMVVDLWRKNKELAIAAAGASFLLILSITTNAINGVLGFIAGFFGQKFLVQAITENDIVLFMALSIAAVSVSYLAAERKNMLVLFTLLVFFPTAFIGLEKVKYTLHLAFAIVILFGFILFESARFMQELIRAFSLASEETARLASRAAFVVMGSILVFVQFAYAVGSPVMVSCSSDVNQITDDISFPGLSLPSSMGSLCYGQISGDWLDTTKWMRENTPTTARFMSWWDYGHWTTFFGERHTVIDPNNIFDEYDQEVARAIVGDSYPQLRRTMEYHNASYLMLDWELVPKWGALVYLSGSFGAVAYETENGVYTGLYREPDPKNNYNATPGIVEWEKGPGQSVYEQEHYFESLYAMFTRESQTGQIVPMQCPGTFPRLAYYSTLTGAAYCLADGGSQEQLRLFVLKDFSTGEQTPLENPLLLKTGSDQRVSLSQLADNVFIDVNPGSVRNFMNLNPDLKTITEGKTTSKLKGSMFVQFFFCEYFDTCEKLKEQGFEYAYRSPNGQVKIFKKIS